MVTRAVAVMEVSMVASIKPSAKLMRGQRGPLTKTLSNRGSATSNGSDITLLGHPSAANRPKVFESPFQKPHTPSLLVRQVRLPRRLCVQTSLRTERDLLKITKWTFAAETDSPRVVVATKNIMREEGVLFAYLKVKAFPIYAGAELDSAQSWAWVAFSGSPKLFAARPRILMMSSPEIGLLGIVRE